MKKAKRLNPKWSIRRQLFLLSMNICAFPGCTQRLIDQNGHFIGEICHIEAANEEGERFNPSQNDEERRDISNLILFCPTHHKITDNLAIYDVNAMKRMKYDHERKTFNAPSIEGLSDIFIDADFGMTFIPPQDLDELQLTEHERNSKSFFKDAFDFLSVIAKIPRLSRSFYAHGLLSSTIHELSIGFDPRELETRLRINHDVIFHHAAILNRHGLLSELDNDEHPVKVKYWFTTFDREDNQIWLLRLIIERFLRSPEIILDIFENLNFNHLER